jgi:hypothetical protein
MVVIGRLDRADAAGELAAALRAAIEQVRAAISGDELEVELSVKAAGVPDAAIFTDANRPLLGNLLGALPLGKPT